MGNLLSNFHNTDTKSIIATGYRKKETEVGSWDGCVIGTYNINNIQSYPKFLTAVFADGRDYVLNSFPPTTQKIVYDLVNETIKKDNYTELMTAEDIAKTTGIIEGPLIVVTLDYFNPELNILY